MANPGIAVPGAVVPSGSQASPAGPQGIQGPTAVSTDAGNLAVLGSDNLVSVPTSSITAVRLRSFNAMGNPTFECDQVNVGGAIAGGKVCDRWYVNKAGTMAVTTSRGTAVWTSPIVVPGTNFVISNNYLNVTLSTAQASLGATDNLNIYQQIEGPLFRELSFDVHSISLLVRSTVSNLKFGINLRDSTTSRSLTKLCTIPSANTWTLVPLPNLPTWPGAGTFGITAGTLAYYLTITLACGSTYVTPANDTWQTGNFFGAIGQDNFAGKAVNSTFDLAFVQHEPGPLCTTPIDCPFTQNYDDCLRYFSKSYDYDVKPGTASQNSYATFFWPYNISGTFTAYGGRPFPKPMAKLPAMTAYHNTSGAANSAFEYYCPTTYGVTVTGASTTVNSMIATKNGVQAITSSGTSPGPITLFAEWTADTGW